MPAKLTAKQQEELSPRQKQRLCERFNRTLLGRVVWLTLEDGREVLTRAKLIARVRDGVPCASFDAYGVQPIAGGRVRSADVSVFAYINELRQELYETRAALAAFGEENPNNG